MRKQKEYKEFAESVDLVVHTKCPEKWMLIDRQTGEIFQGNPDGHWDRLDPVFKNKL